MYDGFYSFGSIEPAFRSAAAAIDAAGHGSDLKPVLVRRVPDKDGPRLLVHVLFSRRPHSVVVDLTEAYRDCRRAHSLRGWTHGTTEQVFS
jgi:ribulose 1,5-bisphosphate synthetase/thiazole synthase